MIAADLSGPIGRVVVGLATYRRPELLAHCLRSLGQLRDVDEEWQRDVIVVDNDPAGSAEAAARSAAVDAGLRLRYEIEPRPGIAAARNRCVGSAEGAELLAFVDDDEWVDARWLRHLLDTQALVDADLTGGPDVAVIEPGAPRWVAMGPLFTRRDHPTGPYDAALGTLATSNLLIRLSIRNVLGDLFSDAYGLSGGSDRELTLRAADAGLRLAWSNEAVVYEAVDPRRLTVRWALRRGYRVGNVEARIDRDLGRVNGRRPLLVRGARMLLWGAVLSAGTGVKRKWGRCVLHARRGARGAGLITGALGVRYLEYRRK